MQYTIVNLMSKRFVKEYIWLAPKYIDCVNFIQIAEKSVKTILFIRQWTIFDSKGRYIVKTGFLPSTLKTNTEERNTGHKQVSNLSYMPKGSFDNVSYSSWIHPLSFPVSLSRSHTYLTLRHSNLTPTHSQSHIFDSDKSLLSTVQLHTATNLII